MSQRNLHYLFKPRSVALIGASKRPSSVGAVLAHNLFKAGFDGPIMPVNPKHRAIEGVLTYPDVASLPVTPDLAIISTPPPAVPELIAQLGQRGTRAAVVITAGFGEAQGDEALALRQAMLDAAKPHLLRIVGPNCLGIMVPGIGLNASFAHVQSPPGRLAFVAQSGAMLTSVLDRAASRGIGFSHLVSLGDMTDVDFGDMLDYLANDVATGAILLYIEGITRARKFMSAARAAARTKPVILVKAGRFAEGAQAVASHTGSLAGSDEVYDTAFRRAGMLRVLTLDELFEAVETLAMRETPKGARLAILTNGGGIGVLATDALSEADGQLAELSADTIAALDGVLPATWSRRNPVDIIGDAPPQRYRDALEILLQERGVDAVLVLNCPTAISSSAEAAKAVIAAADARQRPAILTSWVGDNAARESRRLFAAAGIPTYDTPTQAVRAFMHMVDYRRNQEALTQTPASIPEEFVPDQQRARQVIERALGEERVWLTELEAKQLLSAYAIPAIATRKAATPREAGRIAAELGGPVVIKILSPDITHKSDLGGVALDLHGPHAVERAAAAMLERIEAALPQARIEGFAVQPMVERPGAIELILGMTDDAQFGPLILFGHGGTAVEIFADKALALPPLNMHLAQELMARTRIWKLLGGYRDRPAANLEEIALTLIKVSQLAIDHPEISELDINPLLADEFGVLALDARVRLGEPSRPGQQRLAIRPYPKELETTVQLGDGRTLLLRPVLPEDEPAFQETFAKLTSEQRRQRFFTPVKTLSHFMAARFTQLDFDREMALVLADEGIPGRAQIYGVASLNADPDNREAEYAIVVRDDITGAGLGILLMRRIIDYARSRGIGSIWGDVLKDNTTMLKMCRALGFSQSSDPDDPGIVKVRLALE